MSTGLVRNSRGSEWRRWDPHLHAPGTLLTDQFNGDWESYLTRIEKATPTVEVLGVTDYFCISTYREVRQRKAGGRLSGVLLFPNVEMRLDIKTAKQKAINIHLLFSPDDPNHENEIERIIAQLTFEFGERNYRCTLAELAELGRAFSRDRLDDQTARRIGATQFKVTLSDLRRLFRSEIWMRQNCLVAVAGSDGDGTAGLQADHSFTATRREIESFANIIFAATPSQREFWLGKRAGSSPQAIEERYGALKPCLHGSDAHRDATVAVPDMDRYCWLKGDATFETLRQAVIEPEDRVWIGPAVPPRSPSSLCVTDVRVTDAPWLRSDALEINSGLVAIIGARGSGKTALADIIAAGANAVRSSQGQSSFLRRAARPVNHVGSAAVELTWADGSNSHAALDPSAQDMNAEDYEEVAYLSQHFVEQLCSSSGLAVELREEMERVVYEATDPTERLEASSFAELSDVLLEPSHRRRDDLRRDIAAISDLVVNEETLREGLGKARKDSEALQKQIEKNKRDLQSMIPKGNEQRAQQLAEVEKLCGAAEARIEALGRRKKLLDDLASDVTYIATRSETQRYTEMRRRFRETGLTEAQWEAFRMQFVGDPASIITQLTSELAAQVAVATSGQNTKPVDMSAPASPVWHLMALRAKRDALKREVGIDALRLRRYTELQRIITQQEANLRRIGAETVNAEGAEARRTEHIASRRRAYADIFATLRDEEAVLTQLYSPLKANLSGEEGTLGKLQFVVRRRVVVAEWVRRGEDLIDLRKETRFRGHGSLEAEAEKYLLGAWRTGSADDVASAMDAFRSEFHKDLTRAMPASVSPEKRREWVQQVAAWLYDTSHVHIEYGIEYDGVAIEQLSPGTRGIVLLLLYLAVDRQDQRPLIIDQPEENLDPNSVYLELVPHFREARKRRQVILVTHNANLVVNTDVDQVIIADSVRISPDTLPTISYQSGSLENGEIRRRVCEILEGGARAFLERERRYRLRWDSVPE